MTPEREADVAGMVAGLTKAQRRAISNASPDVWEAASGMLGMRPGNTVRTCADKGFFSSRRDPVVWGRSQYLLTPLGVAVRALLATGEAE